MTFGERVKYRREMFEDFSQEKLAKMVGYEGRAAINKVEKGIIKVSQDKVIDYAKALKTSPAYLMGWVDDPELTHEETLQLEKEKKIRVIAADTASLPSPIFYTNEVNITQHHKNMIAERIINSNYSDEELNKIEQMLDIIVPTQKK